MNRRNLILTATGAGVVLGVWTMVWQTSRIGAVMANTAKEGSAAMERIDKKIPSLPGVRVGENGIEITQGGKVVDPAEALPSIVAQFRKQAKLVDLATTRQMVTTSDELEFGKLLHEQRFRREFRFVNDSAALQKLNRIAAPLLAQVSRKDIPFQFFIVDSPDLNAFSHAGGYVYVTTGILNFLQSESEIQFVLGHEIAHVELYHVSRVIAQIKLTGNVPEPGRAISMQLYDVVSAMFDQDTEVDCDRWAHDVMKKIGRTKIEIVSAAKRMAARAQQAGTEPVEFKEPKTVDEAIGHEVHNHMRSHPMWVERVHELEKLP